MTINITTSQSLASTLQGKLAMRCPSCNAYTNMTLQSAPDYERLQRTRPKRFGVVAECAACQSPVFLRCAVREYHDDSIDIHDNFTEVNRPREHYPLHHLPESVANLFGEALGCYSDGHLQAFAMLCRRTALRASVEIGAGGKLRLFNHVVDAIRLADIEPAPAALARQVLFDLADDADVPPLNRAEAGILLELTKDFLYQSFVRPAKIRRALQVRRFFVTATEQPAADGE